MKKNNLVKKVALFTAAAVMAVSFTSCGNSVSDKDDKGRTVITVGSYPQGDGPLRDNMEARRKSFEKENTDVVVKGDPWGFERKTFYAKAAGGQLPTVYEVAFTEMPEIIASGYSADLTEALKKYDIYDNFNKDILDVVSKDKKAYAFPYTAYVLGLAYNTELFEKAGLTEADGTPKQPKDWDEVREFAVKIKKATGKAGIVFPSAANNGGWLFTPLAWSFGTEFMKQDKDGKWKATFDSPETVEALQYIKDLKWKYDVLPSNTLIDASEFSKVFGTGDAAMCIAAGDIPRKVVQYGMQPEQLGMMAMPKGPKKHVTLLGGSVYCVNNKATKDQIDAAVRWIKTAYTPEATESFKTDLQKTVEYNISQNYLIGINGLNIWNADADATKYKFNFYKEKSNANLNHVKLYNEFTENAGDCVIQPEEPVCAQELYAILDGCIQEVLVNKDADCADLIKKAQSDFQSNYLDNLDY